MDGRRLAGPPADVGSRSPKADVVFGMMNRAEVGTPHLGGKVGVSPAALNVRTARGAIEIATRIPGSFKCAHCAGRYITCY